MFTPMKIIFIFILFIYSVTSDSPPDSNMIISLQKQPTYENREMFGEFVTFNGSEERMISFANINPNISFVVIQVHVHVDKIMMYKNIPWYNMTLQGRHFGYYSDVKNEKDVFYIININEFNITFYLSVHGYGPLDPVPGGCNLESKIQISPFLMITTEDSYIRVDVATPMSPDDPNCLKPVDDLQFYMLYQQEFDFSRETYYDAVLSMSTLEGIKKKGTLVPSSSKYWYNRRLMSLYPAIGVIFVAVVFGDTGYAVYVPEHTYGCDVEIRCIWNDTFTAILYCLIMFIMSTYLCFIGARYITTETLMVALITTIFISEITFTGTYSFDPIVVLLLSSGIALIFSGFSMLSWFLIGVPLLSVVLSAMNVGFLIAAIIYYHLPSDIDYLQSDFNFWTLFVLVILLVTTALISVHNYGNIVSCAFLGSFGMVVAVDNYIGSNLKFIVGNVQRRLIVPNFNKAILMPPYQSNEKALTAFWVITGVSGLVFQFWLNRGRSAFPPPPLGLRATSDYGTDNVTNISRGAGTQTSRTDERTPLLA